MSPESTTPLEEYAKIVASMLAGMALLLFFAVCWAAKYDFFLVRSDVAEYRANRELAYQMMAVNPIDEFEGVSP